MGAGQSAVEVTADQDSLYLPAPSKSVQTAPFPDDVTFDKFWDALLSSFKSDFRLAPHFKDGKLVEIGENHFATHSTVMEDGGGVAAVHMVYRADKSEGEIYEESRLPGRNFLLAVGVTKVHRDPLRVEYWRQPVKLLRLPGPRPQYYAARFLSHILKKDVQVLIDQESPGEPKEKSALSEPLDDLITADALWDALDGAIRAWPFPEVCREVLRVVEEKTESDDWTAFQLTIALKEEIWKGMGLSDERLQIVVQKHKASRTFILESTTALHLIWDIIYLRITTAGGPLRVESFRFEATGLPFGNEGCKAIVEQVVTKCIKKVQEG